MLLPEWLWPIAVMATVGGFIDFLLGKAGRARLISALEGWWVRFDDVTRHNFGKQEASFAIGVLDRWFGRRFFSIRRVLVCAAIVLGWRLWFTVRATGEYGIAAISLYKNPDLVFYVISFLGLSVSISISRRIARIAVSLIHDSITSNALLFFGLLFFTYGLMAI